MKTFKVLTHRWPETEFIEASSAWHQAIDFSYINVGKTCTANELAKIHGVEPSFYDDVSELVAVGMIEIVTD